MDGGGHVDTVCKNVQRPLCDVGAQILWEEPPSAVSTNCYHIESLQSSENVLR